MKVGLLFVCMGNICRSPSAQGVAEHLAMARGLASQLEIDSAGTHAYHIGNAPDPRSIEVAKQRGIDIACQRARQVQAVDFERFNYLIAMDHANRGELLRRQTESGQAEISMLGALNEAAEVIVPDPYYGGSEGFDQVLDLLFPAIDDLLMTLARRHNLGSS